MRVSVVLTVKDEADSLPALLASLERQTRPPDEVIIVDGGSRDATLSILRSWTARLPLSIVEAPGASIAEGRNLGLSLAHGEIVAVTDGGVVLDPAWLAQLVGPFEETDAPDVVSGFFVPDACSTVELTLAVTTLPQLDEIVPERFLPSSRSVAFQRSWFDAGIRYPAWLDYCEDVVFDLRLRRAGARFRFEPGALVTYRPRTSLRAFALQYFRYARGDGKAGLFTARHAVRYATYFGLVPLVAMVRQRWLVTVASLAAARYLWRPYRRLWRMRRRYPGRWVAGASVLVPLVRLIGDVAKMLGYPFGVWWRLRRYGVRASWRTIPETPSSPPSPVAKGTPRPRVQPGAGSPGGVP